MRGDTPPTDYEILQAIGQSIDPNELIAHLCKSHDKKDVIEGLQRAIEREEIGFDSDGMVVPARILAEAA